MNYATLRQADRILERLLDLSPPDRLQTLSELSDGDPQVEALVRRLLANLNEPNQRLQPGGGMQLLRIETHDFQQRTGSTLDAGERVGHFRLVRILGRGGMATVYLAERADGQFDQQVALKVLDRRGDSIGRFEQERQILASIDHPNVARLIDGGVTNDGALYLAMEFVEGEQILDFCRGRRLGVTARLELLLPIVEAIDDAHRRLIVHRDIKSSNIIVTENGVPKLLDFGIAKLLAEDALPHAAPATRSFVPLTPEYASPEQIRGDAMTVATDIYQLGYLMYLLLTGRSPYTVDTGNVAALVEAITQTDPVPPSVSVRKAENGVDSNTDHTARLSSRLKGDIDCVVLKALHKDPGHRYTNAALLAADIRNLLANRPISARPVNLTYRATKFARRHYVAVPVSILAVLAVLSGTTIFTLQLSAEKERATLEASKATEVATFMQEMFGAANPAVSAGEILTARDVLDQGLERVQGSLDTQPAVKAALLDTMAYSFIELGDFAKAENIVEEAIGLKREVFGVEHPEYLRSRHRLAMLRFGQGEYAESERISNDVYQTASKALGDSAALTQYALAQLGLAIYRQSRFVEAEEIQRRRRELTRAAFGADHPDMVPAHNNIAITLDMQGRNDEALEMYREAYELGHRILGDKHPSTMDALNNIGLVLERLHRDAESEETFRRVIELRTVALGEEHPRTLRSRQNLASLLATQGKYAQAEPLQEKIVATTTQILGEDDPQTLWARLELAGTYAQIGRSALAESELVDLVEQFTRAQGPGHYNTILAMSFLGKVLRERGDFRAAIESLESALRAAADADLDSVDRYLFIYFELASAHMANGAEPAVRSTLARAEEYLVQRDLLGSSQHARFLLDWGSLLASVGRFEAAESALTRAFDSFAKIYGHDDELTRTAAASLVDLLTQQNRHADASRYRRLTGESLR